MKKLLKLLNYKSAYSAISEIFDWWKAVTQLLTEIGQYDLDATW